MLASGMCDHRRLRDLADIQALIQHAWLVRELGERLHPCVRAKYEELWAYAQSEREWPENQ
jgi:hypothetical protein